MQKAQRLAPHDAVQADDVFRHREAASLRRDRRAAHGGGFPVRVAVPVRRMNAVLTSWAPASAITRDTGPCASIRP
ncbi:hypothetical protein G6F44_013913 [Rhizopus delemar]|nr:hypothetical protein G6F44_013913 [Rhizopus delemar]